MIRAITEDELGLIDPIMIRFDEQSGSGTPPNFIEIVKSSFKEKKTFVYGAFTDDGSLKGISMFGNVSKRLSFVFADGDRSLERKLVDAVFYSHSPDCPFITAGGPWLTETISNHLTKIGFRKLDRAFMTLGRGVIESLELTSLNDDMKFEVFDGSQRDELSKVIFRSNDGHVDQIVFPMFFRTLEDCRTLIENIENNVYGDYIEGYSWLLKENDRIIGACLMTVRNKGDSGYIPDIVIDPDYQGKGWGKRLLIHSMKEIITGEPNIVKIDLDVTLENNAQFLYKSLGYETVHEYSMYSWLNKGNN